MSIAGLSVGGSDNAADAFSDVQDAIAKVLEKELRIKGNEYNTPGCIDVLLIFDEFLSQPEMVNSYPMNPRFIAVVRKAAQMTKRIRKDWLPEFQPELTRLIAKADRWATAAAKR